MAVVPTPPTIDVGISDTTELNQFRDAIDFTLNRPAFRGRQTSAQTLTSSAWASITLEAEDLDDNPAGTPQHDTATNNTRFTAVYAGWYLVSGGVGFSSMATPAGRRGARLAVNGALVLGSGNVHQPNNTSSGTIPVRPSLVFLSVGGYVEIQGFFEGGGTLATSVTATEQQSSLDVIWVRNT